MCTDKGEGRQFLVVFFFFLLAKHMTAAGKRKSPTLEGTCTRVPVYTHT